MTRIFVKNLQIRGNHGISEIEKEFGNRLSLDITAVIDEDASSTDEFEHTVDYVALAKEAVALCENGAKNTLEWVGSEVALRLLVRYDRIKTVTVRIAKLNPPLDIVIESVGVEVELSRVDLKKSQLTSGVGIIS